MKDLKELLLEVNEEEKIASSQELNWSEEELEKIAAKLKGADESGETGDINTENGGTEMTKETQKLAEALLEQFKGDPEGLMAIANDPEELQKVAAAFSEEKEEEEEGLSKEAEDELMEKIAYATIEGRAQAQMDVKDEFEKEAKGKAVKQAWQWASTAKPVTNWRAWIKRLFTETPRGIKETLGAHGRYGKLKGSKYMPKLTKLLKAIGIQAKTQPGSFAALTGAGAAGAAGAGIGAYKGIRGLQKRSALAEDAELDEWLGKVAAYAYFDEMCKIADHAGVEMPKIAQPADEASVTAANAAGEATTAIENAGVDPSAAAEQLIAAVAADPAAAAAEIVESKTPEAAAAVIAQAVTKGA